MAIRNGAIIGRGGMPFVRVLAGVCFVATRQPEGGGLGVCKHVLAVCNTPIVRRWLSGD